MSLKAELERWVQALECFDTNRYVDALALFETIADSSKILFNMGLINANMGDHRAAVKYFRQAQDLDSYFAVSYFQCGVSYFLLGQFQRAVEHFQEAHRHMRENGVIDYEQIGLKFKLYTAEILFNQGLSYIQMGQINQGMQLIYQARCEQVTEEHTIIAEAYAAYGRGFTVFSVPADILFRPSDLKVKNLKAKNYLGTAKLVAATAAADAFIGFTGVGARSATQAFSSGSRPSPTSSDIDRSLTSKSPVLPSPLSERTNDITRVQPLRLRKSKSSVDLRSAKGSFSSRGHMNPADVPAPPDLPPFASLPRLNTNLRRPSVSSRSEVKYSPQVRQRQLSTKLPFPLTPPESEPDYHFPPAPRIESSDTALGYLGDKNLNNQRDSGIMEELVEGYSVTTSPTTYTRTLESLPQSQPAERVAAWANRRNKSSSPAALVNQDFGENSNNKGTSEYPSSFVARRHPSHRPNRSIAHPQPAPTSRAPPQAQPRRRVSADDTGFMRVNEMLSFRIKLHIENDVRGMSLDADTSWSDFYTRLQAKFALENMNLKYKDEDGTFVTIADEDDWDSAIDAARENCRSGRQDGKLEIWVADEGRSSV